jgi:protein-export membrane protein SecD/preprotein translocase SecF subunit
MLRRLIVFTSVMLVSLFLMFMQNKVMVGDMELQALLQPLPAAADAPAGERTYKITFTDLGGNLLPTTTKERDELAKRLEGNTKKAKLPVKSLSDITADKALLVVVGPEVKEEDLKRRLQGMPFRRRNESKELLHVNPGIDLRGGVEFICQLRNDLGELVAADEEVMVVLRSRLDERGLTEPVVSKLSNGDVQVVIPGGTRSDAARTRKVLEDTGRLEFREVLEDLPEGPVGSPQSQVVTLATGGYAFAPGVYHNRGDIVAPERTDPGFAPTKFYRLGKAELTGKDVKSANQTLQDGEQAVGIQFTAPGATRNEQFTQRLYQTGPHGSKRGTGRLAILFDGVVQSDPIVQSPSRDSCVISGRFTQDEIDRLRTSLRAGSLTVVPEVTSERVVGATLGHEAVERAITTMLWSLVFIVGFLMFYYRRLGLVATFSLIVTGALTWSTMSIFGATLTLPGIAGLVLAVAMSIDTNVLIYERIREELRAEKGLAFAIERGYKRAFLTVIDSQLTTMGAGFVLYLIGTGPIKGFGLTLMIGIGISLFAGIYVGRMLTDWLCRKRDTLSLSSLFKEMPAPYVQLRKVSYTLTLLTAIAGMGWFLFGHKVTGGGFDRNFDIDFTGGNMVQVVFKEAQAMDAVQKALAAAEAKQPADARTLDDVRAQAYIAEFGQPTATSRQWMFRGRDEPATRIEAERTRLEAERAELARKAKELRDEKVPNEVEARQFDKQVDAKAVEIRSVQARIQERTTEFRKAINAAFPGAIAAEGEEILGASFDGTKLVLTLATIETPSSDQTTRVANALAGRDELAAVTITALPTPATGMTIEATYRKPPTGVHQLPVSDTALDRLVSLIGGQSIDDQMRGRAVVAFELYNSAIIQAAKVRLTVAQPFPSSEHFSGQVANQMKVRALLALGIAMLVMMFYIAARFELAFGLGGVISLLHVVVQTVGMICLLDIRIDLTVVAALLTIIGYAINDTIVTYDRIRENLGLMPGSALTEVINKSIAQTMPRTFLTGGCTIAALCIMLVFAGDSLTAFTATLLIGVLFGTFSSVFVAAPLLLALQRKGKGLIDPPAVVVSEDPATSGAEPEVAPKG